MTAVSARRPRTARRAGPSLKDELAFWIFVGPFALGLLVFTLVPILWSAALSLFQAQGTVFPDTFVGLSNYLDFLNDAEFLQSLGTFLLYSLFIVPVTVAASLGLALLLNRLPRFVGFFRSVFFLPVACSYVVASLIWKLGFFNALPSSAANQALTAVGLDPIFTWLTQSPYFWIILVTVRLWLQVGFYMLLFAAALQRIPESLYEAATLDGVRSHWGYFRHITLPQIRSTTSAVLLLVIIAAFQAFDEFYNIMGPGPTARPPLVYLYFVAFKQQDFGHGAAGALILTLIMVVVALAQSRLVGFGANDDDRPARRRSRRITPAAAGPHGEAVATATPTTSAASERSAHREPSPREPSPRESAPRESTQKESA